LNPPRPGCQRYAPRIRSERGDSTPVAGVRCRRARRAERALSAGVLHAKSGWDRDRRTGRRESPGPPKDSLALLQDAMRTGGLWLVEGRKSLSARWGQVSAAQEREIRLLGIATSA